MSDAVYKKIEVTGTSAKSIEEAIRQAVERASKTLRKLRWFEVAELRGQIEEGKVTQWQATVKIGFTLDEEG